MISLDYITGFSLTSSFKSFITFDKRINRKDMLSHWPVCINEFCEDAKATSRNVSVYGGWIEENWEVEREREKELQVIILLLHKFATQRGKTLHTSH